MKKQLLDLYLNRHADLKWVREQFPNEDMAGPFLMSPSAEYALQPHPLLIIGQETGGWHYHLDELDKQMNAYETFNVGEQYYASPFWNVTRKVEAALGNKPYTCAWTNLSKYDLNDGHAYGEFEAAISSVDDILLGEINIIKPKVCVFFTGPSMDTRLSKVFRQLLFQEIPGFEKREFAKLSHPALPEWTFRSYHPKYLRMQGKEEAFIDFIMSLNKVIA